MADAPTPADLQRLRATDPEDTPETAPEESPESPQDDTAQDDTQAGPEALLAPVDGKADTTEDTPTVNWPVTINQHGLRFPDGTELWAPLNIVVTGQTVDLNEDSFRTRAGSPFDAVDLRKLSVYARHRDIGREKWPEEAENLLAALQAVTGPAHIDLGLYAGQVELIERNVTITIGEDITASRPLVEHRADQG